MMCFLIKSSHPGDSNEHIQYVARSRNLAQSDARSTIRRSPVRSSPTPVTFLHGD